MPDPDVDDDLACVDVVEQVTELLEGALEPGAAQMLHAHLAGCDGCQAYVGQMRTVLRVLAAAPAETVPDAQLAALRAGDEQAFTDLVAAHGPALMWLATQHTRNRHIAEEVVQETWLAVMRGIGGFEGRSSLRTWMSTILVHIAARRSGREARSVPMSPIGVGDDEESGPTVDPARFLPDGPYAGHWRSFPDDWSGIPESALLGSEVRSVALAALSRLPPAQRAAVSLRDLEGWSSAEVSELLGVSQGHQRVLLHRGRAHVREELEKYLDQEL